MKLHLSFLFFLVLSVSFVFGETGAGCDQSGAWNSTAFDELISKLSAIPNELTRRDELIKRMDGVVEGFNSDQLVTLLKLWRNQILIEELIENLNPWILGITCEGGAQVLKIFSSELTRLDALKYLVNLTIDLEFKNQTYLDLFSNTFNKRDAKDIIDHASPRSCIWGDVTVKRLIFIVDTSGSMSEKFKSDMDGKYYTRLEFVANQLDSVIRKNLKYDQEFNVISFSDYPKAWNPGVVPVTDPNIDSAVQFVNALKPGGGTSMLSALKLAFQDPKALAIYLLTDGVPTDATPDTIIKACQQWSTSSNPARPINAIAFLAGGTPNKQAADFMKRVAEATGGIFRAIQ